MQKSTNRFFNSGIRKKYLVALLVFFGTNYQTALGLQSYKGLTEKVQINLQHTTAAAVVKQLEQQTGYTFIYDPEYLEHCTLPAMKLQENTLGEVLHYLDVYSPIDIAFNNKTIALRKGKQEKVAEKGRVTGKVVDSKNEPLPGVTVQVEGGQGTITSVDGTYDLQLEPGTYTLVFSYVSYESRKITEVVVKEKINTPLDIVLKSKGSRLKEITVTANYRRASVEGLYALQKNNAAITDGISSEQIGRTPDKNIGEVLKRVSGLATVDNKYVVVRGLSERYNQAVLNGQIMPSTELNRKNFSFDIIPANLVENVTVVKTLTADRSAEFGGGLVEVNTLDIPTQDFLNIGVGGSINDKTTGKNFRTLKLEGKEYWGSVADHRKLLGSLDWKNTTDILNKFNAEGKSATAVVNNWGVYEMKAQPSQNYQISGGKVIGLKNGNQLGLMAAVNYRNTLQTQDVRMSRDGFEAMDNSGEETVAFSGKRYGFTTNISGMLGVGYRTKRHRISFQSIKLRTLDQQLIIGTGNHENRPGLTTLGYYDLTTQTDLWQNQLKGEHAIGDKGIKLKWMGSYTRLDRQKPDNHEMKAVVLDNDYLESNEFSISEPFSSTVSKGALRWWSRALENNYTWDAALSVPFKFNIGQQSVENTFKGGYAGWNKNRLFYVMNAGTAPGDASKVNTLAQTFAPASDLYFDFSNFSDDFKKAATLHAVYGMFDDKLGDKWRLVWGVRAEYYNLNNVNQILDSIFAEIRTSQNGEFDYSALKDREPNLHIFPSANLTYSMTPAMNLRLAYSKSIIRPDLRELSFFREYDFELGGAYISDLVRSTQVQHVDFRYEWYPGPGEILSFSLFYKNFDQPMEIVKEDANRLFSLKNNKKAENYGIEVEARKSLAFTKVPVLQNITLYGNFTWLDSWVTPMTVNFNHLDPNDPTKVLPMETVGPREKRPQTGASNYMANAGIYYDIKPVSLSVVYNYVSNRMFRPASTYSESLFERPLEALDAQLAIRFLKNKGTLRLNVANLLNSYSLVYKNRYEDPNITNRLKDPSTSDLLYKKGLDLIDYEARPGRTYSATLNYNF